MFPLIQYHISHDTHPSAIFGLEPLFPATLLTNASYTNVTGGQVVELTTINGKPTIVSGIKAESSITTPDIFFLGGLIHAISDVLTIPISFPATVTAAGLNDLVALLNKGGWLTPNSPAVTIVNTLSDLTLLGPNDPKYGASFTGWDGLDESDLMSILQYSITQGTVGYSSVLKNNTKYPTLDGISLTVSEIDSDIYVDAAKIKTRDYLCSNGVMQIIDQPLNPNTTDARPAVVPSDTSSSSSKKSGISGAAGAGIGIAIGAVFLGTVLVAALVLRNRKRKGRGMFRLRDTPNGRGGRPRGGVELQGDERGAPPRYELDNKTLAPQNVTTYEISPITPGTSTGTGMGTGTEASVRGTQVVQGEWYGHDRSRGDGNGSGGGGGGFIIRGYSPTENEMKPPSPLEIDGQERSRISITVHGEAPRHLGFQARY